MFISEQLISLNYSVVTTFPCVCGRYWHLLLKESFRWRQLVSNAIGRSPSSLSPTWFLSLFHLTPSPTWFLSFFYITLSCLVLLFLLHLLTLSYLVSFLILLLYLIVITLSYLVSFCLLYLIHNFSLSFSTYTITLFRRGDFIQPENCEILNQTGNIFCKIVQIGELGHFLLGATSRDMAR